MILMKEIRSHSIGDQLDKFRFGKQTGSGIGQWMLKQIKPILLKLKMKKQIKGKMGKVMINT